MSHKLIESGPHFVGNLLFYLFEFQSWENKSLNYVPHCAVSGSVCHA